MTHTLLSRKPEATTQRTKTQAPASARPRVGESKDFAERKSESERDAVGFGDSGRAEWSFSNVRVGPPVSLAGEPLEPGIRSHMESRLDHDFSRVLVRTGTERELAGALAYAEGEELVFAPGSYAPDSPQGGLLLAHELAHVVQQTRPQSPSPAAESTLEAEASSAAQLAVGGHRARVRTPASRGRRQYQHAGAPQGFNWKSGDILLNADAVNDVKVLGALLSGPDQAHVNVSRQGHLSYDLNHANPTDAFRWQKLKDIVDTGHIEIKAVATGQKFKVKIVSAKGSQVVDKSIDEIKVDVRDISVTGITLVRQTVQQSIANTEAAATAPAQPPTTAAGARGQTGGSAAPTPAAAAPITGSVSASSTHDQIFYDKDNRGALAHELFGHAWLAAKGVPFTHPEAGSPAEATQGTLSERHGILDPFGQTYKGTVKDFIAKFIESGSEEKTLPSGQKVIASSSPTEGVSQQQFRDALFGFITEAKTGLAPQGTLTFSARLAQQLRLVSNNYDALTDPHDRQLIIDFLGDNWFSKKLTPRQQEAFREMLDNFKKRKGWWNQFSEDLQKKVGSSTISTQMYQSGPTQPSPGGLQLSHP